MAKWSGVWMPFKYRIKMFPTYNKNQREVQWGIENWTFEILTILDSQIFIILLFENCTKLSGFQIVSLT